MLAACSRLQSLELLDVRVYRQHLPSIALLSRPTQLHVDSLLAPVTLPELNVVLGSLTELQSLRLDFVGAQKLHSGPVLNALMLLECSTDIKEFPTSLLFPVSHALQIHQALQSSSPHAASQHLYQG